MYDGAGTIDERTLARRWARAEAERDKLVRLARGRGLSQPDAEDCVHEAMLRVIGRPDVDEDRLGGLLTTVVVRLSIDMHRRVKVTARVVERAGVVCASATEVDPASVVCDRAEARWTAALVDQLPDAQRQALLAKADGRAVKEIAAEMSTSAKAVESLISRARAATRSAMGSGLAAAFGWVRRFRFAQPAATATAGAVVAVLALPGLQVPHLGGRDAAGPDRPATVALRAGSPGTSLATATAPDPGTAGRSRSGDGPGVTVTGGRGEGTQPVSRVGVGVTAPDGRGAGGEAGVEKERTGEGGWANLHRCARYGPTVGWTEESFPLPDEGEVCRHEPGSPLWR